jgi:hypothetical protein
VPFTEQLSNAGIDLPQETDVDLLKKIERNTLSKADLIDWYQDRVNRLRGALNSFSLFCLSVNIHPARDTRNIPTCQEASSNAEAAYQQQDG